MSLLKRRCMSCTTNPADVEINCSFIQYAWCEHCWGELDRSIQSMKDMIRDKRFVEIGEPITEPLVFKDENDL